MKFAHSYRIRLLGILVLAVLRFGLFGSMTIGMEGSISLGGVLDNILFASVLIWETSRAVVLYIHRRYTISHLSTKRFGLEIFGVFIANGIIYSAMLVVHEGLPVFQKVNPLFLLYGLVENEIMPVVRP